MWRRKWEEKVLGKVIRGAVKEELDNRKEEKRYRCESSSLTLEEAGQVMERISQETLREFRKFAGKK